MMEIQTLSLGHMEVNCYVVSNPETGKCVVIDPGDESNVILDYIEDNRLECEAIMITHGHYDHTGAVATVAEETGATVYMNEKDDHHGKTFLFPYTLPENGKYYDDGDTIEAAGLSFHIMATPGHSAGSVTIVCEDALFTGDTLFKGSCGRVDLESSDPDAEMLSLKYICSIEGEYDVYPGHMDPSTLSREKAFNYYCRQAMHIR